MAEGHSWSTVFRFLVHFSVFLPLQKLFAALDLICSHFFRNNRLDGLVEVRRVLWRFKIREVVGSVQETCLHVHARYEDARTFVWSDPRVHLYNLTQEGAMFVRTTAGVDVYHSEVAAFAFHSVRDNAEEFAIVPYDIFRNMATEELDKLSSDAENKRTKKVVVIASPARCGSTFMLQHFEDVPGSVAICEPQPLLDMCFHPSRAVYFKSVFFFVCKPLFLRPGVKLLAIKLPILVPWLMRTVADLRDIYPLNIHFLFTHRKPIPAFNSWLRFTTEILSDALTFGSQIPIIGRLYPNVVSTLILPPVMLAGLKSLVQDPDRWARRFAWLEALDFQTKDKKFFATRSGKPALVGRSSLIGHFLCFYLAGALTLRELKRRPEYADDILPVAYEELTSAPQLWKEKILPFCGLAPFESTAARHDSQRHSAFERSRLSKHSTKLLPEDVKKLDEIVKATGIAETLEEFELKF